MPLVRMLWDTCVRLSQSDPVADVLDIPVSPEHEGAVHAIMFQTQLTFVVSQYSPCAYTSTVEAPDFREGSADLPWQQELKIRHDANFRRLTTQANSSAGPVGSQVVRFLRVRAKEISAKKE
jgi:hypothetical protein